MKRMKKGVTPSREQLSFHKNVLQNWEEILGGDDLRSLGKAHAALDQVHDQRSFDSLFAMLFHPDRRVVMRAADAIEKITRTHSAYLRMHVAAVKNFCQTAMTIEFKWHLAQLVPRLKLSQEEATSLWTVLKKWAFDSSESKIVRVNALQSLYELQAIHPQFHTEWETLIVRAAAEPIPSLKARVRRLRRPQPPTN
jgi:hypothetical protein